MKKLNPSIIRSAAKKISLRDYQERAVAVIRDRWQVGSVAVLSICPSGGKTKTSLVLVLEALSKGKRVLILSHGTTVLKNQWVLELNELGIKTSSNPNDQIVVAIPHAIYRKSFDQNFDLVVIDEAHEFYLASMVQEIIERAGKPKQLLLTGTPSVFIKLGHTPIVISAVDVFKAGFLSDTKFGLVESALNLRDEDYRGTTEVVGSYKFKETELKATLKLMFNKIAEKTGLPASDIKGLFKEKTMIAARSVALAKQLAKLLSAEGISVLVSTVDMDADSSLIKKFTASKRHNVLIVVRRGILGFNFEELVNVIDFTCSRNIDRIYQLYARVLRKHPKGNQKYFFRILPSETFLRDAMITQMSLALCGEKFISEYDGTSLNSFSASLPSDTVDFLDRADSKDAASIKSVIGDFIRGNFESEVLSLNFFASDTSKLIRFSEVIYRLTGGESSAPGSTVIKKKQILKLAVSGHPKPTTKHVEDGAFSFELLAAITNYVNPTSGAYDEGFKAELMKARPDWFLGVSETRKIKLIALASSGAPKPTRSSDTEVLRQLSSSLANYTTKTGYSYDDAFTQEIRKLRPDWFLTKKDLHQELIRKLAKSGAPKPSQKNGKNSGKHLSWILSWMRKGKTEDNVFMAELRKLRSDWFVEGRNENKEALLLWAKKGLHKPSRKTPRLPGEKNLCICLSNATRKKSSCYDDAFARKLRKLRPDWFLGPAATKRLNRMSLAPNTGKKLGLKSLPVKKLKPKAKPNHKSARSRSA